MYEESECVSQCPMGMADTCEKMPERGTLEIGRDLSELSTSELSDLVNLVAKTPVHGLLVELRRRLYHAEETLCHIHHISDRRR